MFASVSSEIGARLLLSQRLVAAVAQLEQPAPDSAAMLKGFCFVQMYAIYEYAVRSAVQAALASLKGSGRSMKELHAGVLCLVLESVWAAAAAAGAARVWDCRVEVLRRATSDESVAGIDDTLFPTDGSHYRVRQLHTIWQVLGVAGPVVPEPRLLGRIEEIVENRNAITHGRRTADDVGRGYSRLDIEERFNDLRNICEHVLGSLERHYSSGGMLVHA